jgi:hypothetical protein
MQNTSDSQFVRKTKEELKQQYKLVAIYVGVARACPLGSGHRYVYWVAGDGLQTLVYQCNGLACIIDNQQFKVMEVVGAAKTMINEGRVLYLENKLGAFWEDLGPITSSGKKDVDDLEIVKRTLWSRDDWRITDLEASHKLADKSKAVEQFMDIGGSLEDDFGED